MRGFGHPAAHEKKTKQKTKNKNRKKEHLYTSEGSSYQLVFLYSGLSEYPPASLLRSQIKPRFTSTEISLNNELI